MTVRRSVVQFLPVVEKSVTLPDDNIVPRFGIVGAIFMHTQFVMERGVKYYVKALCYDDNGRSLSQVFFALKLDVSTPKEFYGLSGSRVKIEHQKKNLLPPLLDGACWYLDVEVNRDLPSFQLHQARSNAGKVHPGVYNIVVKKVTLHNNQ